ncbi:hypothetical protein SKAU_G00416070 [Synaphobranchus kaupii]|uniref:Uncharacterized protein n=1 Tax=Synaphobranchus kaupii TaxID=118154 RepID=A0A9Q1IBJ0_SYNKA|nr:hypothetical protein SKAU_G00416070 [Synaphobranchus kaupii]
MRQESSVADAEDKEGSASEDVRKDVSESAEDEERTEEEGGSEGNAEELLSEDPGLWPEKLTTQQRDTCSQTGW